MITKLRYCNECKEHTDHAQEGSWGGGFCHKCQEREMERILKMEIEMGSEILAKWLHDCYEQIAADESWKTQPKCRVQFDDLPEANKNTMLKLAKRLINQFKITGADLKTIK